MNYEVQQDTYILLHKEIYGDREKGINWPERIMSFLKTINSLITVISIFNTNHLHTDLSISKFTPPCTAIFVMITFYRQWQYFSSNGIIFKYLTDRCITIVNMTTARWYNDNINYHITTMTKARWYNYDINYHITTMTKARWYNDDINYHITTMTKARWYNDNINYHITIVTFGAL